MTKKNYQLVLFDLDGTLVDTAPDLAATLDALMLEYKKQPLPYQHVRPHVSNGALGLIRLGFDIDKDHPDYAAMRERFLDLYAEIGYQNSQLFDEMHALLDDLAQRNIQWGIVTNKPERFTTPLVAELGLDGRSAITISGDTLHVAKPSPEPILHACEQLGIAPENTVYIGDAERDIQAGNAANNYTIAVSFGYIPEGENPESWGADVLVHSVSELRTHLAEIIAR